MQINLLAFGIAKDILGGSTQVVELDGTPTVAQLKAQLCEQYPDFVKLASLSVAVNTEYAGDDQVIKAGDEVVIIPPVSGG